MLRKAGAVEACEALNISFQETFGPLTTTVGHPYKLYRWSGSHGANGHLVIYALPPEEETGWPPWEWLTVEDGQPIHIDKVQFPIKDPIERGIVRCYIDGKTPVIHHLHYIRKPSDLTEEWSEKRGVPQRSPEVVGRVWYWYDTPSMTPALENER